MVGLRPEGKLLTCRILWKWPHKYLGQNTDAKRYHSIALNSQMCTSAQCMVYNGISTLYLKHQHYLHSTSGRMRKKFTKQTKVLKNLSGSMLQLCSRPLGFLEQVATESELIAVTESVRSS